MAPSQTPPVSILLDALPTSDTRAISRHLGVSPCTVARWARTGNAPRLAHLALFWETRWGLSALHAEAVNGERWALGLARALREENEALRARLVEIEAQQLDGGAANAPYFDPGRPPPAAAARLGRLGQDMPGRVTGRGVLHRVRL